MKQTEFKRGVIAAAHIADGYNTSSTHPYRLGDCIMGKLNVTSRTKPRRNRSAHLGSRAVRAIERRSWLAGFAVALAEMRRELGNDTAVRTVARAAGLTLDVARQSGVDPYDIKDLKRAGVP